MNPTTQTDTAKGLGGLLILALALLLFFHFVGFRAIVTVGRSVS
jgi:hypothetical protein